ncbi:MAG TPA: acyl-CoA dehydrogenase family protein, partial [Gaiellaceae bacterium]|nr:acyl-CoA dehydrogenase family protein [Gaiellaceae bacterium]
LAALIPEEFGGAGLGLTAASVILEEINASGCNSGACHAQMYTMGTILRHGSEEQKQRYLPRIASGELRLQAFGKPIGQHQAVQLMLAKMATRAEAARLLVLQAAQTKARGDRADLEAGMAKLFATEAAQDNALDCMRIHGGYGYSLEFRPERYYRDAPLLLIGEGSNEIQQLIIARRLLERT